MKRFLTLFSFICAHSLSALPVGNPAEPTHYPSGLFCSNGHWHLRAGFYGDYVFNRHLEVAHGTNVGFPLDSSNLEHVTLYTNAGEFTLNLFDRLDLFTVLGVSNLELGGNISSVVPFLPGLRFNSKSSSDFSWSVGARTAIWEWGPVALGVEGQYFSLDSTITRTIVDGFSNHQETSFLYHEWQIGAALSYEIHHFSPYAGIKYARARIEANNPNTDILFREAKQWGYVLGASLLDKEHTTLTAEVRFGDEKALYVHGGVCF